jgi:hypothetical protein
MATRQTKGSRQYGAAAQKSVASALHRAKQGKLKSGAGRHPKVKSRAQAIAIGLSEAREKGAKVPPAPAKRSTAKRGTAKRGTAKRSTTKRSTAKRGTSAAPAKRAGAASAKKRTAGQSHKAGAKSKPAKASKAR